MATHLYYPVENELDAAPRKNSERMRGNCAFSAEVPVCAFYSGASFEMKAVQSNNLV